MGEKWKHAGWRGEARRTGQIFKGLFWKYGVVSAEPKASARTGESEEIEASAADRDMGCVRMTGAGSFWFVEMAVCLSRHD